MLEGQNFPVPVPERNLLGRSLITNNGYVYWVTKTVWNSDKQQSEDDRKSIGKLIFSMEGYDSVKEAVKAAKKEAKENPEKKLMMWANDEYPKLFADLPETEKLIHNSIMGFGVYLFALKSAEQTGVLAAIKKAFPKHWSKVFAICVQWIDASSSDVSQVFETWFYDHFCGFYTALDPSAFTDFYKNISHIPYIEKTYRRTVCEEYSTRFPPEEGKVRRAVGCDSTNHNHESDSNSLGGFGHAKVDKSRPIFNRMTFVDEVTGLTIFSDLFPGPILDKTEIPHTMDKLVKMGFQELHCMFDRGFPTKDTVILFQELKKTHNICFSAMVPSTYSFADKYIENYMYAVKEEKNFIKNHNIYGLHLPDSPVFFPETPSTQSLSEDSLFDIYVFYDDYRAADERSSLNDKLAAIENAIEERKDYSSTLDTLAGSYFTI
ncbi:MAG: hypothetical protein IJ242_15020, partial [Clostridia bacterium]|nr:hypothetical protein [Clostridia bacterium]